MILFPQQPEHAAEIGRTGEATVAQALQQQGWVVFAQRWHCRWGELDLIVTQAQLLAFVEVKTRSDANWDIGGLLAVDRRKQAKMIRAARQFLQAHPQFENWNCRFDVALVRVSSSGRYSLAQYIPSAFEL
jgi:putative endonuclease